MVVQLSARGMPLRNLCVCPHPSPLIPCMQRWRQHGTAGFTEKKESTGQMASLVGGNLNTFGRRRAWGPGYRLWRLSCHKESDVIDWTGSDASSPHLSLLETFGFRVTRLHYIICSQLGSTRLSPQEAGDAYQLRACLVTQAAAAAAAVGWHGRYT